MPYLKQEDQNANARKWYRRNRKKVVDAVMRRRKETKAWFDDLKVSRGCERCGYDRCAEALHGHHVGTKNMPISMMVLNGFGKERILSELDGCELLCANCHRELHSGVQ